MQDPILTPIFLIGLAEAGVAGTLATIGPVTITATTVASLLTTATLVAGAVAVNYAMQRRDAPSPEQGTMPLRQTIPPRIAGFGEVRVAGNYVFYETRAGRSDDIVALCQGPIGGYKQVFLDDTAVAVNPVTGQCNAFQGQPYTACNISANRGLSPNAAWNPMPDLWTPDHRGDGVVSLWLSSNPVATENFMKFYPRGLPQPSAAVFLPCWDFRDPAQNPDDPLTWLNIYPVWDQNATYFTGMRVLFGGVSLPSLGPPGGMLWLCLVGNSGVQPGSSAGHWVAVWKNPVLQIVTFLISQEIGMGLPRETLIEPVLDRLTAEAAKCDVAVPRNDDIGSYEARYTSNTWFKLETDPVEVLGQILAACDGWAALDGDGTLSMRVGLFDAATTVTLTEEMIINVELNYGAADEDKIDELTLSFTSPAHNYTVQAIDSLRDEEAILNRGKIRSEAFGPASVQSHTQTQRLSQRIFLRANWIKGSLTTHLGGMIAAGQRYVKIHYPLIPELTDVYAEIRRRDTDLSARQCRFEFILIDPTALDGWHDPSTPPVEPPVTGDVLPVPQNVAVAPDDGVPPFRIDVSWDDPQRADLDFVVRYRQTDTGAGQAGPWLEQVFTNPLIVGGRVLASIVPGNVDVGYEIQVASQAAGGTRSSWSDSQFMFVAPPLPGLDFSHPANSAKWLFLNDF